MMTSSKAVSASCPGQCECVGESVNCDDASLYHFPNDLPNIDQFATFSLRHNQLTSLNGIKAELKYHHVRKLNLSSNQFESLDFGRFESIFPRLEQLDLSHNRIATVIPGKSSWRLTTLSLADNRLVGRLPDDAFTHLAKLVRLDLSDNSLEGFERDSVLPPQRDLKLIMRRNPAEFGCEFMLSFWPEELAAMSLDDDPVCSRIGRSVLCLVFGRYFLYDSFLDDLSYMEAKGLCKNQVIKPLAAPPTAATARLINKHATRSTTTVTKATDTAELSTVELHTIDQLTAERSFTESTIQTTQATLTLLSTEELIPSSKDKVATVPPVAANLKTLLSAVTASPSKPGRESNNVDSDTEEEATAKGGSSIWSVLTPLCLVVAVCSAVYCIRSGGLESLPIYISRLRRRLFG